MKTGEILKDTINLNPRKPVRKIGLFGGTFDPVHNGHMDIAEKVFLEFSLSFVLMLISGDPPHKQREDMASAQDRFNMASLAAKNHSFIIPSDVEITREGKIYTIDTLKILKKQYPDDDFYYIIGKDTLFELETWKDIEEVFRLTKFICIGRAGFGGSSARTQALYLKEKYGADIYLSSLSGPDISSSMVRQKVRQNQSIAELTDENIGEYIKSHALYK